jgi:hypothetical protein
LSDGWGVDDGIPVQFQQRPTGTTTWQTFATVPTRNGGAHVDVKPSRHTQYRYVVAVTPYRDGVVGRVASVHVQRALSVSMKRGTRSVRITAAVTPAARVYLQIDAKKNGHYTTVASASTKSGKVGFTVSRKASTTRYRVLVKSDSAHTGTSKVLSVPRRP